MRAPRPNVCTVRMQETVTSRRLIENFADIASGLHFDSIKRPLEGAFEEEGCKVADIEKVSECAECAMMKPVWGKGTGE